MTLPSAPLGTLLIRSLHSADSPFSLSRMRSVLPLPYRCCSLLHVTIALCHVQHLPSFLASLYHACSSSALLCYTSAGNYYPTVLQTPRPPHSETPVLCFEACWRRARRSLTAPRRTARSITSCRTAASASARTCTPCVCVRVRWSASPCAPHARCACTMCALCECTLPHALCARSRAVPPNLV